MEFMFIRYLQLRTDILKLESFVRKQLLRSFLKLSDIDEQVTIGANTDFMMLNIYADNNHHCILIMYEDGNINCFLRMEKLFKCYVTSFKDDSSDRDST
ncbi:CLUMA_CG007510, isoform A [Clunio marinus]|uniref:CLUMA_CG007510, isoform A n=1 Tax=Clunio marinus TaxID=568069 RepID=A0A1J1I0X5_9DIPT|nr:CLUMA_CG007510, isoform A [Clunio marinus]